MAVVTMDGSNPYTYMYPPWLSIPIEVGTVRTLLLPLEGVGEGACLARKGEVVTRIWIKNKAALHGEAMEVACK